MHDIKPEAERYPVIQSGVWTKINDIPGYARQHIMLINTDASNDFRIARRSQADGAPTDPTAGMLLPAVVGVMEYTGEEDLNCDYWAYQSSGGDLETLFVQEGK